MKTALSFTFHGLVNESIQNELLKDPRKAPYTVTETTFNLFAGMINKDFCISPTQFTAKYRDKWIIITFDDGFESDYLITFPILQRFGLKAIFFVTARNIGKPGYLNAKQIRHMSDAGMEIGSHGLTHEYLITMSRQDAINQIQISKDRIEQITGRAVNTYAPVGGHFNRWMIGEAQKSGYTGFATMIPGLTITQSPFIIFRRNHIQLKHNLSYILKLLDHDYKTLTINILRYYFLFFPKKILGLHVYDQLKAIITRN